jgi:hypothetical protein
MHGTGVALHKREWKHEDGVRMPAGVTFADHGATDATHGPTGCARMGFSKTTLSKSQINKSQFRSDDRTGMWPWKFMF